jgi:hypothetical protein
MMTGEGPAEVKQAGGEALKKHLLANRNSPPEIYPDKFEVGAVGEIRSQRFLGGSLANYSFKVLQVIDDNSALIVADCEYPSDEVGGRGTSESVTFRVTNLDFRNYVDGKRFWFVGPFTVAGTYRYVNTLGAAKTVYDVEPVDMSAIQQEVAAELAKGGKPSEPYVRTWALDDGRRLDGVYREFADAGATVVIQDRQGRVARIPLGQFTKADQAMAAEFSKAVKAAMPQYRTWTDKSGAKSEAEFVGIANGIVTLRIKNSTRTVSIRLYELSKLDREWIRQHLATDAQTKK